MNVAVKKTRKTTTCCMFIYAYVKRVNALYFLTLKIMIFINIQKKYHLLYMLPEGLYR